MIPLIPRDFGKTKAYNEPLHKKRSIVASEAIEHTLTS